eukprot:TRINITY_DN408_c1_g1_i3.p2 TRINITY_DN408_c1_g1~~TRINITY_DN408_c1_g1_i3.p2  ORF type:complete len:130 (-),score=10.69 TRINITY_DN408_c1_g1_i3:544-933(-)
MTQLMKSSLGTSAPSVLITNRRFSFSGLIDVPSLVNTRSSLKLRSTAAVEQGIADSSKKNSIDAGLKEPSRVSLMVSWLMGEELVLSLKSSATTRLMSSRTALTQLSGFSCCTLFHTLSFASLPSSMEN